MSIVCLGLALRLRRRRNGAFLINHSKGSLAGNVSRHRHPRIESLTRRRRLLPVRGVVVDMKKELGEQEEVGLAHSDAHPRHRTCLAHLSVGPVHLELVEQSQDIRWSEWLKMANYIKFDF